MSSPIALKDKIRLNVSLKSRTTFAIGGQAQYWYEPADKRELVRFLKARDSDLPLFVIGCGSNLLVREGVIKKVFIHLGSPAFNKIKVCGRKVFVGAGVKISRLLSILKSKDVTGYEFLAGIPGTVGGAIAMNAGAKSDTIEAVYQEMKDVIRHVDVLDEMGRAIRLGMPEIVFSYRASSLKSYIIISAVLELAKGDRKLAAGKISRLMKYRRDCQDYRYPSAGSFFRNPLLGEPAGRLIDLCRFKGFRVGGAQVSDKHANFIVNVENANSDDVIKIMEKIKQKVYNRFKIELVPEVEIVA